MKWITREHPKIDRIACPWLIRRFIDPSAEFIFVPFDQVIDKAKKLDAIPFDMAGVELTHYGDECTFDYLIKKYKINSNLYFNIDLQFGVPLSRFLISFLMQ